MRKEIMGVTFDDVTLEEAVAAGEALAAGPGFSYVVTPNPEIVAMARQTETYREILNGAGLVLPDGIGVVHAAKILGTPLKGRVPGIDFASALVERLARNGLRLFLLGAKPGVAEQAAAKLAAHPGLRIAGTHDGYFQEDGPVIEAIRQNADNGEAATDLLMVAKYFERIGDHATNIAQWAIFAMTGERPKD